MKSYIKVIPSVLESTALSDGNKQFLREVGLLDDPASHLRPLAVPRVLADGSIQVATEGDVAPIVVLSDGSVRMLDGSVGRFVNTTLRQFAAAMEVYEEHYSRGGSALEPPSREDARRLREALKRVDPTCFSDRESYWSVIVEQVRDGLL
ncbi:MAG: SUKH-4 family immunity protein [Sandaracinaceae bacterium]|nr:SUKH-4 family immunity protein [Sandaracinaceae bacterium]